MAPGQRDVWLDQQAWPGSTHLNIGGAGFLEGPLDLPRMREALGRLVAETDALRLAPLPDGTQRLLDHHQPHLDVVDLSHADDPREAMRAWWQKSIAQPFALDGTPPWRFALLRARDDLHGVSIQFHHSVMDGWGSSLVGKRWAEIYNALARGEVPPPSHAPGYGQFIEESVSRRGSPAQERDAAYWRSRFPEPPAPLVERRYGLAQARRLPPARVSVRHIPRADYDAVEARARTLGTNAFGLFLCALAVYFGRVCSREEVVVGVPSLNRSGRRYRDTPGMFVGVLPLRVPVLPEATVASVLAQAGTALREGLRHPHFDMAELGGGLQAIRQGREAPFDLLLSFERQDYTVAFGEATLVDSHQRFSGTARYPLAVTVCEFHPEQDVDLVLEGSAACFTAEEVELLSRRLWDLMDTMARVPEAAVADLSIVPPEERWALLEGMHRDVLSHPAPESFVGLLERQAALRPDATALLWDGGSLDHGALQHRVQALAGRLAAMGAGRGEVVAVCAERSPALVIALLGAARAGAAFLPLDPDAPVQRLATILEDSGAAALITSPALQARLSPLHPRCLVVDESAPDSASPSGLPPLPRAEDAAYVLFTSGSTGRPKGVVVEHGTLSRRLAWLSRAYAVDWEDRSALATQITFDPALIELCLPLVHGAAVAVPPAGRLPPEQLADFAVAHRVTIMAFVPSTLSRFLDAAGGRAGLTLRVACCGGEVLAPELANRFLDTTRARLYNVYGPTEACIFATAWECERADRGRALPIGRPVDDTRIYVLDGRRRLLPFGVTGEIWIGGAGLARGYLHRPELDAEAFMPDPFVPGARMYRTGDRGYLGTDGNLHFLGRIDRQVKLRGYRIELGEIEAALLSHPGVAQAAVRLVERDGRPVLQAWAGGTGLDPEEMQATLRARLPDYMVPAGIAALPSLPANASGKIDYAALPDLTRRPGPAPRAAATELERQLLAIWARALRRPELGVRDNFFDLGGDSFAAVEILAGVDRLLGERPSLYLLAENPTVELLAAALGEAAGAPRTLVTLTGTADRTRPPLYLAASGHGDLVRFRVLAQRLAATCAVHMLQPPAGMALRSIDELAEHYAQTIAARGDPPGFVAGFSVGGIAALETACHMAHRGMAMRGLVLVDTVYPGRTIGVPTFWRQLAWLTRVLHVGDLVINGRRIGSLFEDAGLSAQVMALRGYRPRRFDGPVLLIKTHGLAGWDRWLFRSWRKLLREHLVEQLVPGLHGSMFEPPHVDALAAILAARVRAGA